jgi:hypothetical protein
VVSVKRNSNPAWGNYLSVAERDLYKKVNWTERAECMVFSVSRSESGRFLLLGDLKEHVSAVPPRTIENLVAKLQAAVTKVGTSILIRVRENAVCIEMDGEHFEHLSDNLRSVGLMKKLDRKREAYTCNGPAIIPLDGLLLVMYKCNMLVTRVIHIHSRKPAPRTSLYALCTLNFLCT